ncbi:MAG TPA: TIGR03000 domain-containing protein [Gemmataceae bacterium]|nr:TIGR03000 domain-containing protein [Gemmataceae bacterium]
MAVRPGTGYGGMAPGMPGMAGAPGAGYGGGAYPYPGLIIPYYQGGYNFGGYDPMVASVPSAAYLTLGNTSYTTESPSPIPVYAPRPPFAQSPPPMPLTALLQVQVPQDAEVWLEGQKMRSMGSMRHFRSPPLNPTKEYGYEVRARWQYDGKPVEDVRHIAIRAGATVLVDFTHLDPLVPRPSAPSPPPSKSAPAKPTAENDASTNRS